MTLQLVTIYISWEGRPLKTLQMCRLIWGPNPDPGAEKVQIPTLPTIIVENVFKSFYFHKDVLRSTFRRW